MCLSDVRNLTKLVDLLLLIAYVILLVLIQFQYLQQEQILALQKEGSYSGHVTLGNLAREGLF